MYQVEKYCSLKKFSGKSGWTYAEVPEILPDPHAPFGWVRVNVVIDNHTIKNIRLMPMGNGQLFLPVNAKIRKIIGKQVGDEIHLKITRCISSTDIPPELMDCFALEPPEALRFFMQLKPFFKKAYLDWIESSKSDNEKVWRIRKMMDALLAKKISFIK